MQLQAPSHALVWTFTLCGTYIAVSNTCEPLASLRCRTEPSHHAGRLLLTAQLSKPTETRRNLNRASAASRSSNAKHFGKVAELESLVIA